MATLKRPMFSDHDPRGPTVGLDVKIAKFAACRYEDNALPVEQCAWSTSSKRFGSSLYDFLKTILQPREHIPATGNIGQATWDVLWQYLDAYRKSLYIAWKPPVKPPPIVVPDLGPLYNGGSSVLYHQLTHNTDGIPYYPAYDDGWVGGMNVLAVEDMIVSKASGSTPGDAFYAVGKSKLAYWYGHLITAPSVGRTFRKGEYVGRIYYQGSKSHVHLGIDARPLIGHTLLYGATGHGPDYSFGSPPVGTQLKEALAL